MKDTDNMLTMGKVIQLPIETGDGINCTNHYPTGRLAKNSVKALSGMKKIPVIQTTTRNTLIFMREVQMGANNISQRKSSSDITGRTRKFTVIYTL